MISPERVEEMARDIFRIYRDIELRLIENIARRVVSGDEHTQGGGLWWDSYKLDELGALTRENLALISAKAGLTQAEVERVLRAAGVEGLALSESITAEAFAKGLLMAEAPPLGMSASIQQILQTAIANTRSVLNMVNTTALESARAEFLQVMNAAHIETSLGTSTYQEAINRAVQQMADRGITGATYRSEAGRVTRARLDTAVRRAVLTSSAQMAGELQVARAKEWGVNLVEVSSHWDARPSHAEWQGKIYQLEGRGEYDNLADATGYGTVTGLCGANCRHVFYPFFEGISEQRYKPYDQADTERRYNLSQEQRKIERDIRDWKRREAAARGAGDEAARVKAAAKIREKQAKMREFIERSDRTRRRTREQLIAGA